MVLGLNEFGRKLKGNKASCYLPFRNSHLLRPSQGWISATASTALQPAASFTVLPPTGGPLTSANVLAAEAGGLIIKPCGEPLPASLGSTALGEEGCSKLCNLSRASQVASSQNHHPTCFTRSAEKKSQDGGHTARGVHQAVRFRGFSFDHCANLPL